jgi:pimeloyl-ACP methyl ester carboxylesterase
MPEDTALSQSHQQQLRSLLKMAAQNKSSDYANLHIRALPNAQSSISYFEFGDPSGHPLLCLHGLSVTGLFFEQYHKCFVAMGIRAIAPCLLGGIYVPDADKTMNDLTGEVIELLDSLAIDKFDVLGFSWGTLPELALIARIPERIGRAGFLGAMVPMAFLGPRDVDQLKPDIRLSLKMVEHAPLVHRCLMWLVCRLPTSALVEQFRDRNLSMAESQALAPDSSFYKHFSRCISECVGTGSDFFTHGWRMVIDEPGYGLRDLAGAASRVEVRLYVGEQDNVHLPAFSQLIAAACSGTDVDDVRRGNSRTRIDRTGNQDDVYRPMYSREKCSIWTASGAGRMACILYFKEALANLMSSDTSRQ